MIRVYATAIALACGVACAGTAVPSQAGSYQVLHIFNGGSNGYGPLDSLIQVGGRLYGTTLGGHGASKYGNVFSMNPATGVEKVVYPFQLGVGTFPEAGLLDVGGTLYGATGSGGTPCINGGCGTVFALNPTTGVATKEYSFRGGSDGAYPLTSLITVGGTLYGTTYEGGGSTNCSPEPFGGCGTVFSVNQTTGAEAVVYAFQGGSDGASPYASPIDVGGTLYGTTYEGGGSADGTVFEVDLATGTERIAYSFQGGADGAYPRGSLIKVGSTLYGTTYGGGAFGDGTVFSLNPKTGKEVVVYSFQGGSDGAFPYAGVIDVGGTLYGTTYGGGASGDGTVFALNPTSGAEMVVHSFQGGSDDGAKPYASLLDVDGALYGTTLSGGVGGCGGGCGTVFGLMP